MRMSWANRQSSSSGPRASVALTPAVKETFNHRSETRDSNRTPSQVIVISRDWQLIVSHKPFSHFSIKEGTASPECLLAFIGTTVVHSFRTTTTWPIVDNIVNKWETRYKYHMRLVKMRHFYCYISSQRIENPKKKIEHAFADLLYLHNLL